MIQSVSRWKTLTLELKILNKDNVCKFWPRYRLSKLFNLKRGTKMTTKNKLN